MIGRQGDPNGASRERTQRTMCKGSAMQARPGFYSVPVKQPLG